jgi:protein TonB
MQELDDDTPGRGRWLARAGAGAAAIALLAGLGIAVASLSGGAPQKPRLHQIALIKQPPPPPPKPPEKPPEPPKVKDEVKVDVPKPRLDEPKPADDKPVSEKPLGVDADGSAGSDGFGLAANPGGRDLLSMGSGGSGRYYTGLLQRNFFEALARNRKAPLQEFSVVVSVWLSDDGRVQRTEIVNGSGNPQIDSLIQNTLAEMAPLREVPPNSMRQVQLRLNRRA